MYPEVIIVRQLFFIFAALLVVILYAGCINIFIELIRTYHNSRIIERSTVFTKPVFIFICPKDKLETNIRIP